MKYCNVAWLYIFCFISSFRSIQDSCIVLFSKHLFDFKEVNDKNPQFNFYIQSIQKHLLQNIKIQVCTYQYHLNHPTYESREENEGDREVELSATITPVQPRAANVSMVSTKLFLTSVCHCSSRGCRVSPGYQSPDNQRLAKQHRPPWTPPPPAPARPDTCGPRHS